MPKLLFAFLSVFCLILSPALAADAYVCPMHCEGSKTYDHPGKCPVCGMPLEKLGEKPLPLNTRDFRVDQALDPKPLRADRPASLTFYPRHTKDGSPVKELSSPLQATMISDDLTSLQRLKIEKQPDHAYRASVHPFPGRFLVFVEFTPTDGPHQVFPLAMEAQGASPLVTKLKPLSQSKPKESDKISVASVRDCLVVNEEATYFERIPLKTVAGKLVCETKPRSGLYRVWYDTRQGQNAADFHVH